MAFDSASFEAYKKQKLAIVDNNYYEMIKYYHDLKDIFLLNLRQSIVEQEQQILADNFLEAVNQIKEEVEGQSFNKIQKTFVDSVQKSLSAGGELADFKKRLYEELSSAQYKGDIKKKTERANITRFIEEAYKVFDSTEISQLVSQKVQEALIGLKATTNTSNQSYTYASNLYKRILMTQVLGSDFRFKGEMILSQKSLNGYKRSLSGYLSEDSLQRIITDFLNKNGSTMTISPSSTNQPYYDLVLGTGGKDTDKILQNEINEIENLNQLKPAEMKIEIPPEEVSIFGIQSKIGNEWSKFSKLIDNNLVNPRAGYFSIGGRKDILNHFPGANSSPEAYSWERGWHNYAAICSTIMTKLLGNYQLAYNIPGGLVWTYTLIQEMHKHKFYLNFYFNREKGKFKYPATTGEVVWQPTRYLYSIIKK